MASMLRRLDGSGPTIVRLVLAVICAVWLFALGSWSGLLQFILPHSPSPSINTGAQVLGIFGVGLTIAVGVLWLASEAGIIKLAAATGKAIWLTLIVAVLGTSATVYKGFFSDPLPQRLRIDSITLLDVDVPGSDRPPKLADPITRRATAVYEHATDPVAFVAIVSGFGTNDAGNPNLTYHFYLEHPGDLRAHYAEGTRTSARSPYATEAQVRRIAELFGEMSKRVSIAYVIADREDIGRGTLNLRAIIRDEVSHETAEATTPLVFR